jgi:regulation of enolase protein 1 (concanavalin A-like superfamily)
MYRVVALLLCCTLLAVAAVVAAPAPFPRPGRARPWFDGWDKPVDPVGDCKFDRTGDSLTITIPGKGHELDILQGRLKAPRLLRDIEGDFIVQVRVRGNYRQEDLVKFGMLRQAGLLLWGSRSPLKYAQSAKAGQSGYRLCGECGSSAVQGGVIALKAGPPLQDAVTLCLTRRGSKVWMTANDDHGKTWRCNQGDFYQLHLAKKVKVGVFVEGTVEGTFQAVFDQFKLTPLDGKTR